MCYKGTILEEIIGNSFVKFHGKKFGRHNISVLYQGSHRLEKYSNIQDCLEKSLQIKFVLKSTWKSIKCLESLWILLFSVGLNTVDRHLNQYKMLCLYLVQQMLHQMKAQQFHTNFPVIMSPLAFLKYNFNT